jgi:hypothetical protein
MSQHTFTIGEAVHWTECKGCARRGKRRVSLGMTMSRKEGKVIGLQEDGIALVRMKNGRKKTIAVAHLRKEGEPGEISNLMHALAGLPEPTTEGPQPEPS